MLHGAVFMRTSRRRLLLGLGAPLLVLLAISMWQDYRTAVFLANDIHDHNLDATAMLLTEHLEESGVVGKSYSKCRRPARSPEAPRSVTRLPLPWSPGQAA